MENDFNGQNQVNQDGEWQSAGSTDNGASSWGQSSAQGGFSSQNTTGTANTYAAQGGLVEKPVNMVTGIVGAFIGVLIGVVLWVIIYQMGFIAGIAGFVMMICAFKGFELLGGRINIVGAIICIAFVLIAVYFGHNISVAISIMQEMDGVGFSAAYKSIPEFRKLVSEFDKAYLHDLLFGYGLTLVAIIPSIKGKFRR